MDDRPDPRNVLANERTLLAWLRTALALMGAGVAVTELLAPATSLPVRAVLGIPLIVFGALAGVGGYRRWRAANVALEAGADLPATRAPLLVTAGVVGMGLAALLLALAGARL